MAERFSLKGLQEKCKILEAHVQRQQLDAGEDPPLEDYRPGGKENKQRGVGAWVFFYAQLVRLCGKAEYARDDHEEADATVLDALRNEPLAVELIGRTKEKEREVLTVYPKSIGALMVCHALDWQLGWLGSKVQALKASDDPQHLDLLTRALDEIGKLYALLAWIVSHPTPGLPYPAGEAPPTPPDSFLHLDTLDLPRIAQAFGVVNAQRLQALDALLAPQTGGHDAAQERPSWSVFVGSLAIRLNKKPSELMYDLSLGEMLAMIRTHGHAELQAHEAAQRESKADASARGGLR